MPEKKPKFRKNKDGVEIYPVDRETHRMMHYDAMYYVPHKAYDEYDFLKILSMKRKGVKEQDE